MKGKIRENVPRPNGMAGWETKETELKKGLGEGSLGIVRDDSGKGRNSNDEVTIH